MFCAEEISNQHGGEKLKVLRQAANPAPFTLPKSRKADTTLSDYVDLMMDYDSTAPDDDTIEFCANVPMSNWPAEIDEIRSKLPSNLLWSTSYDGLSYCHQHICGVTCPQMYLKVGGCWTGIHEENLRLVSINNSHGPGDCEWWASDPAQANELHARIKSEFKIDIWKNETSMWPEYRWLLAEGFKVYHGIQKAGDLVVVGYGTPHWVKSHGCVVNTSWNLAPKTASQFELALERAEINRNIEFNSIVPLSNLALEMLNYELTTLPGSLVKLLMKEVQRAFQLEHKFTSKRKLALKQDTKENIVDNCEECFSEILWAYGS
jgi:hypothetical protein